MAHLEWEGGIPTLRDDWHLVDVEACAKNIDVELTDDQAIDVMVHLAKNFDANEGINWDVIQYAIEHVLGD
jgi:hypothetical protein